MHICKSYCEKTSGTFFIWTWCSCVLTLFILSAVCIVTVDDESMESIHAGNMQLTAGERKQLQQNMRYMLLISSINKATATEHEVYAFD